MKINSVELENIRSYTEERVSFPSGTVLLAGDIGHGKSSLLMGIEFALFGIRRGELSGGDLLRENTGEGSVALNFSVEGNEYEIKRTLKRKSDGVRQGSGYIVKGGKKKELTPTELKAEVFDILGYPLGMLSKQKSLIYRYTVYTPQEEMKEIIEADNETRLETLRKVFGINKYKRIRENIDDMLRKLREHREKLEGIHQDLGDKEEAKEDLDSELEEQKEELDELEEERDEIGERLEELKEKKQEIKDELEEYHELDKEKEKKETELKNKREKAEGLEEAKGELEEKIQKIEELERPTDEGLSDIQKKKESLEDKLEEFLEDRENIPEVQEDLKNKEKLEGEVEGLEKQIQELKGRQKTLNETLEKLEKAEAKCPVCGREMTEKHKEEELGRKRKQIEKTEEEQGEKEEEKSEKEGKVEEMEEEIEEKAEKAVEEVKKKIKEHGELEEDLEDYKDKQEEKGDLEEKREEKEKEIESAEGEVEEIEGELEGLEEELEELEDVKEKEEELDEKIEGQQKASTEAEKKISEKEESIKKDEERLRELEEEIEEKKKAKKLDRKLGRHGDWLENYLGNLTTTIERKFMIRLQKQFNSIFSEWFDLLVDDIELNVRANDQFDPIVERDGYETKYRRLSGGERTSVALAYRLALNSVINSLIEDMKTRDLIILDEPTDGFSTDQLDKIRDIIDDLGFRQTILVSHEAKVEGFVDNVIQVYKEEGVSRIEA